MTDLRFQCAAIETERLRLEPQTAAHAEAMFALLGDPAIYIYENEPPPSLEWLRDRYARLETRQSPDGRDAWLNWVVRLRSGELIGYVQATATADGSALIAYEMASAHWGRGLASEAVGAMIDELRERHRVHTLRAIFKRDNQRSRRLLERLHFTPSGADELAPHAVGADECMMHRPASDRAPAR